MWETLVVVGLIAWTIALIVRHHQTRSDGSQEPGRLASPTSVAQIDTTPPPPRRTRHERARDGVDLGDGVGFELGIVGESNYMSALRAIAKRRTTAGEPVEFIATLQLQPDNPYDANAVVVLSDFGETIGYLSRGDAVDYGPALKAIAETGHPAQCRAKLVGGTREKRNMGVWLDIDDPDELLARVTNTQPF